MPHGCRTRRTIARFAGIVLALTLATGCQRLAISPVQPVALPPSPSPAAAAATHPETTAAVSAPQARTAPATAPAPGDLVGREPWPQAASDPRPTPVAIAPGPSPSATPMLDAALRRTEAVAEMQGASLAENAPGRTPIGPQPGAAQEFAAEPPTQPEARSGAETEPDPLPKTVLASTTLSQPPDEPKADPRVEAAAVLVPERAEPEEGVPRPINPDRPAETTPPRDHWHEGLDQLRSVARDRAEEPGRDPHGLWSLRSRMLDWLDEPESLAESDEGALRRPVLTALATMTGPTPAEAMAQAPQVRAAVVALEDRAPLEITDLQLCRKVKGFGDFEPLEAAACRPGHGVILYCEMAGVRYGSEDSRFRSRLSARVEVVPAVGGEPVWTHSLGTADDLCHRRRRDYYINYRITLPESLAPGPYELRLIQVDLIANQSTTRAVPLLIQP